MWTSSSNNTFAIVVTLRDLWHVHNVLCTSVICHDIFVNRKMKKVRFKEFVTWHNICHVINSLMMIIKITGGHSWSWRHFQLERILINNGHANIQKECLSKKTGSKVCILKGFNYVTLTDLCSFTTSHRFCNFNQIWVESS